MATISKLVVSLEANSAKLVEGVKRSENSLKRLSAQSRKTQESFGNFGRSAGQAGIQIQQFIGQVQGGVNPLVAFSQQAADLGVVLGAPLLGAVTGIAAAFAGPMISALVGVEKETNDLSSEVDELAGRYDDLTAAQRRYYDLISGRQIQTLKSELVAYKNELDSLVGDPEKGISGILNTSSPSFMKSDQFKTATDRAIELGKLIDDIQGKIDNLKSPGSLGKVSYEFEEMDSHVKLRDELNSIQRQFETPAERFTRSIEDAKKFLDKFGDQTEIYSRMIQSAKDEYQRTTQSQIAAMERNTAALTKSLGSRLGIDDASYKKSSEFETTAQRVYKQLLNGGTSSIQARLAASDLSKLERLTQSLSKSGGYDVGDMRSVSSRLVELAKNTFSGAGKIGLSNPRSTDDYFSQLVGLSSNKDNSGASIAETLTPSVDANTKALDSLTQTILTGTANKQMGELALKFDMNGKQIIQKVITDKGAAAALKSFVASQNRDVARAVLN